jgi:hypothetical protein
MIVRQNHNSGAGFEIVLAQPRPYRLGHMPQLGIGVALYPVAALDLQGDVLGPALYALDEAIVKCGHWFRENIT